MSSLHEVRARQQTVCEASAQPPLCKTGCNRSASALWSPPGDKTDMKLCESEGASVTSCCQCHPRCHLFSFYGNFLFTEVLNTAKKTFSLKFNELDFVYCFFNGCFSIGQLDATPPPIFGLMMHNEEAESQEIIISTLKTSDTGNYCWSVCG